MVGTAGTPRSDDDGPGPVTVRFFGMLHTLRREAGLAASCTVDVPRRGIAARELAAELDLPLDSIEGVFCNGDVFGLSRVVRPGDRVAFVPYGTPGPHRYYLGLYKAGQEDEAAEPCEEE